MTQTRLTKQQRAENMRGAFAVRNGVKLNGEKIIVVDDVFTTGATTSACAQALRARARARFASGQWRADFSIILSIKWTPLRSRRNQSAALQPSNRR